MNKQLLYLFLLTLFLSACKTSSVYRAHVVDGKSYHSAYDDSTLAVHPGSILMPYNRFIDPAGTVIRFGNQEKENHSLDCILLPDSKTLVVEDRYGLAFLNTETNELIYHLDYSKEYKGMMSVYSGIKPSIEKGESHIFWTAVNKDTKRNLVLEAIWDGKKATIVGSMDFPALAPAPLSLPNDLAIQKENGETYLFVVLNGNNQVCKVKWSDKKVVWTCATGVAPYGIALAGNKGYVTNWGGRSPLDSTQETAGVPYGQALIDHRTGGTLEGTVSVLDLATGTVTKEIKVGLHPNAILGSADGKAVYVANGNSDYVSVINTATDMVVDSISVRLNSLNNPFIGDQPNALAFDENETHLYVANGMDNALAVIDLKTKRLEGFIPTEAYPGCLILNKSKLFVCNIEGEGSRVKMKDSYTAHHEEATVSIIPIPTDGELKTLTTRVEKANLQFRTVLSQQLPRPNIAPKPVPERIGEPSVFKHVLYIIKENRTYDQVLGDVKTGDGMASLCIYGDSITPNQHQLARDFMLLDNYYASGKSSAEGHQWTDAAMTSDYVEKNVRAWFRSYPHVQEDALVYNKEGFLWNDALDHSKSVRIYGEACLPRYKEGLKWMDIYKLYKEGKPFEFRNETTISRVRPIMSMTFPCGDDITITDQLRADAFIKDLKQYEQMQGDSFPELMIMTLPNDHTSGTRQGVPTPRAMVADNDLALGKIIDALSHSRFWNNTVVFVTEDDSQDGWDHVSAYRTTGFVVSAYSRLKKTVHTNFNQTCIVRTIEQILGIPPMNTIDATALPMFDCFQPKADLTPYNHLNNVIPIDEMNKDQSLLQGIEKHFAIESATAQFDRIDGGNDDLMNRILWFAAKGKQPYPKKMTLGEKDKD